jgi:hypothetical protein
VGAPMRESPGGMDRAGIVGAPNNLDNYIND